MPEFLAISNRGIFGGTAKGFGFQFVNREGKQGFKREFLPLDGGGRKNLGLPLGKS
jgi:hypothetical protein